MRLAAVVLVEIGEGGKAVGGDFLRLAAAVHLGVDRQRAASHMDDLALEGDDVARKNREFEVDAVKHQQDGVFGVDVLRHSEIRALEEILRATTRKEGLMVVKVGKLD